MKYKNHHLSRMSTKSHVMAGVLKGFIILFGLLVLSGILFTAADEFLKIRN